MRRRSTASKPHQGPVVDLALLALTETRPPGQFRRQQTCAHRLTRRMAASQVAHHRQRRDHARDTSRFTHNRKSKDQQATSPRDRQQATRALSPASDRGESPITPATPQATRRRHAENGSMAAPGATRADRWSPRTTSCARPRTPKSRGYNPTRSSFDRQVTPLTAIRTARNRLGWPRSLLQSRCAGSGGTSSG
jgi:hypothetical protein